MRPIILITGAGEFVAQVYISAFPDAQMPDVVMWGVRTFLKHDYYPVTENGPRYRECFVAAAFSEVPREKEAVSA